MLWIGIYSDFLNRQTDTFIEPICYRFLIETNMMKDFTVAIVRATSITIIFFNLMTAICKNKYKGNYRRKKNLNSLINDYRHNNLHWYIQIYSF